MTEPTQKEVDELFVEVKAEWDKRVAESGHDAGMFIAMDNTGFASGFLYHHKMARDHAMSLGLTMPELVDGMTITVAPDNDGLGEVVQVDDIIDDTGNEWLYCGGGPAAQEEVLLPPNTGPQKRRGKGKNKGNWAK